MNSKVYIVIIMDWDYNGDYRELRSIEKVFNNIDSARKYMQECIDKQKNSGKHDTSSYDIEEYNLLS